MLSAASTTDRPCGSGKEGIDESEWCYPKQPADIKEGMKPFPDYLKRKGYRLPTEAEWEYAARANAETSRYYGSSLDLLPRYAWYLHNSAERTWPVGQKRPNDAHGNVWNWIQESAFAYKIPLAGEAIGDVEDIRDVNDNVYRSWRGGAFPYLPPMVRAACRNNNRPLNRSYNVGLRPARTLP
jgi:formylglycine-generating enzyme required for sulfatase activity